MQRSSLPFRCTIAFPMCALLCGSYSGIRKSRIPWEASLEQTRWVPALQDTRAKSLDDDIHYGDPRWSGDNIQLYRLFDSVLHVPLPGKFDVATNRIPCLCSSHIDFFFLSIAWEWMIFPACTWYGCDVSASRNRYTTVNSILRTA